MTDGGRPKDVPVRPLLLAIIPESMVSRHTHPRDLESYDLPRPPPLDAHPQAHHSGRPYDPAHEADLFDLGVVDRMLAQWQGYRQAVPSTGQISFANLEMCASVTPITGLFTAPDLSGPLALTWGVSL